MIKYIFLRKMKQYKHSKAYMLIFQLFTSYRIRSEEVVESDSFNELFEYTRLIDSIYKDTSLGEDSVGNEIKYGWVILDWNNKTVKKISTTKCLFQFDFKANYAKNRLIIKDVFFREEGEVPKDYKWDYGEYDGWLQFRWGDGKNAVDYKEEKKEKDKKIVEDDVQSLLDDSEEVSEFDLIQDEFDRKFNDKI